MITKILKFISGFLSSHLHKDPESIHNAIKAMCYGQAAIAFSIFMNDTYNKSYFMSAFTFLFPIFIAFGMAFGVMSQQKNKSGELLSVAIFLYLLVTLLHAIFLFIFFFNINKLSAFTFALSIIVIFHIFGFGAKLYGDLLKKNEIDK